MIYPSPSSSALDLLQSVILTYVRIQGKSNQNKIYRAIALLDPDVRQDDKLERLFALCVKDDSQVEVHS